ncbi:MAG: c-type cytochrome, partial [Pirellulaceae bacterium]
FLTQFNTNRISRMTLKPKGSTYEVDQLEDFAVSTNKDFRPTDVLQAPDGSLLVIDTGGWFRIGCPQSDVAKSHIRGAIYRIRKVDTEEAADPSADSRLAHQQNIWKLRRVESDASLNELAQYLTSKDPTIRQTAARALLDWPLSNNVRRYIPHLHQMVSDGTPGQRRVAASVLAHWEKSGAAVMTNRMLPALAKEDNDRPAEHAMILALIRSGQRNELRQAILDPQQKIASGAAIALEQMLRPQVKPEDQHWLEIPAPSLGQPLTDAQRETLLTIQKELPEGNIARGQKVFYSEKAACSKCHQVGGLGNRVGPDLTTIGRSRSRADLLESIIYPSATFARGFASYMVATEEGQVYSGIILGEGSETLHLGVDQENSTRIPHESIEEIRASDVSTMPADVHKALSQKELADLLGYLESLEHLPAAK